MLEHSMVGQNETALDVQAADIVDKQRQLRTVLGIDAVVRKASA